MIRRKVRHRRDLDMTGHVLGNNYVQNAQSLTEIDEVGGIFLANNLNFWVVRDKLIERLAIDIENSAVPGGVLIRIKGFAGIKEQT